MIAENEIEGIGIGSKSAIGNTAFYEGVHQWKLTNLGTVFAGIVVKNSFDMKSKEYIYAS